MGLRWIYTNVTSTAYNAVSYAGNMLNRAKDLMTPKIMVNLKDAVVVIKENTTNLGNLGLNFTSGLQHFGELTKLTLLVQNVQTVPFSMRGIKLLKAASNRNYLECGLSSCIIALDVADVSLQCCGVKSNTIRISSMSVALLSDGLQNHFEVMKAYKDGKSLTTVICLVGENWEHPFHDRTFSGGVTKMIEGTCL